MPHSFLEAEIRQQPQALQKADPAANADLIAAANVLRKAPHLLIAARGTSAHAGDFARYHYARHLGLLSSTIPLSLFADPFPGPELADAVLLAISQSGSSPDLVTTVRKARRVHGATTLALTNSTSSDLAEESDLVIDLSVGEELSVPATKTYTGTIMALVRLGELVAPDAAVRSAIVALPNRLAALIDSLFDQRLRLFAPLQPVSGITVVGRGIGHSAALETALKLREVGGVMTEAYSPAALLHGPIAAVRLPQDLWLCASPDYDVTFWTDFLAAIRPRVRNVIVVSPYDELLGNADIAIKLPPDEADWPYAILATVAGQVAALELGERAGVDVDTPFGLRKATLTN